MIGRVHDPADGDRPPAYVALTYANGVWRPIRLPVGAFSDHIDAAHVCADDFASTYDKIARQIRTLRAACEHNDVEFEGEVISADILRMLVAGLDDDVREQAPNIERLLDSPEPTDTIRIRGVRMVLDSQDVLVPSTEHDPNRPVDEPETSDSDAHPPEALPAMAEILFINWELVHGEPLDVSVFDDAIQRLQRLRAQRLRSGEPANAPPEAGGEP